MTEGCAKHTVPTPPHKFQVIGTSLPASIESAVMRTPTLLVLVSIANVSAKACLGKDDYLPDAPVRIGKKYKPEKCDKGSKKGDRVRVGYEAKYYSDCTKFDESYYEGVVFTLGDGSMIEAWEKGLYGMCVFEKRRLTAPANVAYGADGQEDPKVPPNTTLIFDVEMLGLNGKAPKKGREPGWGKNKKEMACVQ